MLNLRKFKITKEFFSEPKPPGTYAIPFRSDKGDDIFMKVVLGDEEMVSDFSLWVDEELTIKYK